MRVKKLMQGMQGDIAGAMKRWEPICFSPAKNYNNDKVWESFENNGLKTKFYKKDKLSTIKEHNEPLENNALMLEDIADPFGDLKAKLNILG